MTRSSPLLSQRRKEASFRPPSLEEIRIGASLFPANADVSADWPSLVAYVVRLVLSGRRQ